MNFLKYIKHLFIFFLTFLLGAQTTYAKTELVLPQNQVSFSIELNQSFKSLEKEVQPNIGFLQEKFRFVMSEGVSAQNNCNFSECFVGYLAEAVGKSSADYKIFWNTLSDVPKTSPKQYWTCIIILDTKLRYICIN